MPQDKKKSSGRLPQWLKNPVVLPVFMLLFGIAGGVFLGKAYRPNNTAGAFTRLSLQDSAHPLVNPLLLYDFEGHKDFAEFKPFKDKVNNLTARLKAQEKISDAGFYFHDFTNGHWVGVNENEKFYPASLLKIPLLIAYLKLAESQPDILRQKFNYGGQVNLNANEYFKPAQAVQAGQGYTVQELLEKMVMYSDNNATNVLSNAIDQNSFNEIFSDLSLSLPPADQNGGQDFMTPKQYSFFFRVLFNGSYLTRDDSEKALEMAAQADFKNGLAAGVPAGITVAHKYGEHASQNAGAPNELHDCGIVYAPGHPYFLCVMTRGAGFDNLANAIGQFSALTYQEVTNNFQ